MSHTREDKTYIEGWHDGYKHAIEDVRHELLTLEAGTKAPVSLDIYEILNFMKRRTKK